MNWQPIETAPRDDEAFPYLVAEYANQKPEVYWVVHCDTAINGVILRWWTDGGAIHREDARYWMPLPKPPAE